jgi:hypothetical protein
MQRPELQGRFRLTLKLKGFVSAIAFGLALSTCALAQKESYTPMPLGAGFGPLDTSPPSTPPDEIIKKFSTKESEFRKVYEAYGYRRSVKVQTIDGNSVDGEYQEVDDVSFDATGKRQEKVVFAPQNSLQRVSMSPADFSDIQNRLPFVLTTEDIAQYNLTYLGKQKVDELQTFVFDVAPKVLEKGKRYFQGKIWVDQTDLQIVVTSGKNVPDDTRKGHEDLSPPFTTYREQVDGKYWFPTYTKADGVLHFGGCKGCMTEDVHLRQIVKYTDYRQFGSKIRIIFQGQDITNNGQPPQDGTPSKPATAKPGQDAESK